jgi:2-C-methyl-D-erythritol 4-phosphate cytidylyltransferase
MARLHIYPHAEPREDLLIVADPGALKSLAQSLLRVAQTPQGFERVKLHTSDGHEYTAMIVSDVTEEEWQKIPPAYRGTGIPQLKIIEDYQAIQQEIKQKQCV